MSHLRSAVDHHVSAILAKLDVTKRRDAVRKARELGLLASGAVAAR
jgi:ATP/maltotriose-dependent transcriptional regulator MalT